MWLFCKTHPGPNTAKPWYAMGAPYRLPWVLTSLQDEAPLNLMDPGPPFGCVSKVEVSSVRWDGNSSCCSLGAVPHQALREHVDETCMLRPILLPLLFLLPIHYISFFFFPGTVTLAAAPPDWAESTKLHITRRHRMPILGLETSSLSLQ